jgi:hypothetical protein
MGIAQTEPEQKKGRSSSGRPFSTTIVGSLLRQISRRVLNVARGVVCGTLGLIDFAFGLKLFISGQFAGGIFDSAFGLIGRALNVFTIHVCILREA